MPSEQELKDGFSTSERIRRHTRHRVRVVVKILGMSGEVLQGLSNDLCERGMALYISRQFQIGQPIQLEFRIPNSGETINLNALVRDCDGFRCGVEFQEMRAADELILGNCCERLSTLLYGPILSTKCRC